MAANGSQSRGYWRPPNTLSQLLDNFWNNFNRAVDFRVSGEPAKGKTQAPSSAILARIHCP